ncbi:MAG: GGDEF domain-containing protein [Polyangiaceae bacterium]|nr:GGDEF domain-containing protein [Polyangiaceae bacterium]
MKSFCLPLTAHGQPVGVLHLASDGVISEDAHHRALLLGEQLSMALANLELREVLRNQSIRDPLTGLFNRRYAEASLEQGVSRAQRESIPLSALMMDVDHFKRFNDTFGHEAGDEVLRALGELLLQQFRGSDVASRIGGEELLVILPGASREVACRRAEELRIAIAALELQHLGKNLGQVTISIGVATLPNDAADALELLRVADEALYRAKRSGRNRVVAAREPVAVVTA